jgi:hypothetical protein
VHDRAPHPAIVFIARPSNFKIPMKIPLIFGLAATFTMSVITLIAHLSGLSTDPETFLRTVISLGLVGVAVLITCMVLGTRQARSERGALEFTYGQAFMAGWMVAVFAAAAGVLFNYLYFAIINPDFAEVQIAWMRSFMEKMNSPAEKIDDAIEQFRIKATVTRQLINGALFNLIFGAIVALITAAIMKRPAQEDLSVIPPAIS